MHCSSSVSLFYLRFWRPSLGYLAWVERLGSWCDWVIILSSIVFQGLFASGSSFQDDALFTTCILGSSVSAFGKPRFYNLISCFSWVLPFFGSLCYCQSLLFALATREHDLLVTDWILFNGCAVRWLCRHSCRTRMQSTVCFVRLDMYPTLWRWIGRAFPIAFLVKKILSCGLYLQMCLSCTNVFYRGVFFFFFFGKTGTKPPSHFANK